MTSQNSFDARQKLSVKGKEYTYYDLSIAAEKIGFDLAKLPKSLKVLFENLLRYEDGRSVVADDVKAIGDWLKNKSSSAEIAYRPARVLMQDFTGVPAVVDLAAMRDGVAALGGEPTKINPIKPVDLVIDHSVMVDTFGSAEAFKRNVELEFKRNKERYEFLKWGQEAFDNFRVVPPGTGICHQVNLEYLAQVVWTNDEGGETVAYPDTLVGTDSHTTMVNGLSVLGWGVGGIEAEAAMLGQPTSMLIPEVVGFKLTGALKEGATATDLVLTITQMLREKGVVGKFVEFFGPGLKGLSLANRGTIANMAPEYGATCGFFPIDEETLRYLSFSGRDADRVALVEEYAKKQGLWRHDGEADADYTAVLELDMSEVEPSLAGPKRPQDRVLLKDMVSEFTKDLRKESDKVREVDVTNKEYKMEDGAVVIAAITSCTNTSNPSVMLAAGLVAKKAREKGLKVKPWVKTSLAPGSQVVTDYLEKAGLQDDLDALGFDLVGYGCTTCIGNSGPLDEDIAAAVDDNDLRVAAVLSGNRNFEGRVSPHTKANYLASPPLVVAYALAGNVMINMNHDPIGEGTDGPVYLRDIWPSNEEIERTVQESLTPEMFKERYGQVFKGTEDWQKINVGTGKTYEWDGNSTYIQNPPYFAGMSKEAGTFENIKSAKVLALLGDSVTTDHISPAGVIKDDGPAGEYLKDKNVNIFDFNSFGSRRGNHEVMMRGTFANIRLQNEMTPEIMGGYTRYDGEQMSIYDASMKHQADGAPLVVIGGKEYGTGSSRDWAAKGTKLLGVKAVIVESFERIHRSNLVGMGVLPLQFKDGENRQTLKLTGDETFDITGLESGVKPGQDIDCRITYKDGSSKDIKLLCRIDTEDEVDYVRHGGILSYVLRDIALN